MIRGFIIRSVRALRGRFGARATLNCDLSKSIIPSSARFKSPDRIVISPYVRIGQKSYIDGSGTVKIGSGTTLAENVCILSSSHNFINPSLLPFDEGEKLDAVCIGEACWLGHGVMVLPGTTIGNNVIIAAGSVARGELHENGIYAGNPAVRVSERKISIENTAENYLQYQVVSGSLRR